MESTPTTSIGSDNISGSAQYYHLLSNQQKKNILYGNIDRAPILFRHSTIKSGTTA
jgi:hypothetical protein